MTIDLGRLEDELKTVAETAGALVLEAIPVGDMPRAFLDGDEFRRVVERGRPQIVYLLAVALDLESEFEEDADEEMGLPSALEDLTRRYRSREGACCQVTAGAVIGGVLHVLIETADWYDTFESEAAEARESLAQASELARAAAEADEELALRECARKLAAHPAFTQGRPSAEKRRALAQCLFQELDGSAVYRVTAMADLISWLAPHGLQPSENA